MIIFEKLLKLIWPVQKYSLFVLEVICWVGALLFLTPLLSGLFQIVFPKVLISFNDFILLVTAAFILAYTYETKRMRQETIFQRKMSYAVDVSFRMDGYYKEGGTDANLNLDTVIFGKVSALEGVDNVSQFSFMSAIMMTPIGKCKLFERDYSEGGSPKISAHYFIVTNEGRDDFLRALMIQDGEIKARVSMSNGIRFIYTYRATQENWKKTLGGAKNLGDNFVLVKKELDEH